MWETLTEVHWRKKVNLGDSTFCSTINERMLVHFFFIYLQNAEGALNGEYWISIVFLTFAFFCKSMVVKRQNGGKKILINSLKTHTECTEDIFGWMWRKLIYLPYHQHDNSAHTSKHSLPPIRIMHTSKNRFLIHATLACSGTKLI